jgi:hypothetical protein
VEVKVEAPYNQGWIAPYIHENGRILEESYTETGSLIRAVVDIAKLDRLKDFVVD